MTDTATRPARPDSATGCPLTGPHRSGRTEDHATGCRCPDTMRAWTHKLTDERRKRRQAAAGQWAPEPRVPAGPSAEILRAHARDGVINARAYEGIGIDSETYYRIIQGQGTVWASTAELIARWVPAPADYVPADRVPALGTCRRLRALAARGFSAGTIANDINTHQPPGETPLADSTLLRIRSGERTATLPRVRDLVEAAYDRLWDQAPPTDLPGQARAAGHARNLAARNKWLPPMYLDDDRLEDPSYHPRMPYGPRDTQPTD